ncbi:MAG TPA: alpha/beta hydrolase fold domain-containing protein [Acidimicrobiales bacterium]|nr:alpha/beta hydrolase fold domain-containing protein [Acidimicrobiales bacterium]
MDAVQQAERSSDVDVVVTGAGFAGLYMLYRLRQLGLSVRGFDSADDVGGTWYWNRYPGARCDIPSSEYAFHFDPELADEWSWSEKFSPQPEILAYLEHVADRYDLRRDIEFSTRVIESSWSDDERRWHIRTDRGDDVVSRFFVMAGGCLSIPKSPDIEGFGRFTGEILFTSQWPHEPVDLSGKKVAVIGTGSSGIQVIPMIAKQASALTVFQRTPAFTSPANNFPLDGMRYDSSDIAEFRARAPRALGTPEATIRERFEWAWARGELPSISGILSDQTTNADANAIVAELIREKIRSTVTDPDTAEALCPKDYPYGAKRPCLDTEYFGTFNLPHVHLVDLRKHPITTITESGIDVSDESYDFDTIVFATGFDAVTGPLTSIDITGRGGSVLRDKWEDGPSTYLGLMTEGFPNFFFITGPGSPSVLGNVVYAIEQHVDLVVSFLDRVRDDGFETIEPTPTAEAGWNRHVDDAASLTLHKQADSWYTGANVPGKPHFVLPYVGGGDLYGAICKEVVEKGFLGLRFAGPRGEECNDGVVMRLQPDVRRMLDTAAAAHRPPMESQSVDAVRAAARAGAALRPSGPDIGEVVDGTLPGTVGELEYRLYAPPTDGPHPIVVYFHGGGWVTGDATSDDPLCRHLAVASGCMVISVNYRHAPEARFPSAVDDAFAATQWVAAHAVELGGIEGQIAVAGTSAGGNLAAVVCQLARNHGGPEIRGQLLVNPVTDADLSRTSYRECGEGYLLTTAMMQWFWDLYTDPADRDDPRASPLRGRLDKLPPAIVVTAEFDPLRDEGAAYAAALSAAGTTVHHLDARGHVHWSVTMVDTVLSGAPHRVAMAALVRKFFSEPAESE